MINAGTLRQHHQISQIFSSFDTIRATRVYSIADFSLPIKGSFALHSHTGTPGLGDNALAPAKGSLCTRNPSSRPVADIAAANSDKTETGFTQNANVVDATGRLAG